MFGVGAQLGPYELIAELGRGGMATLYMGRQTGPGGFARRVAIKVIHPDIASDPEVVKMFLDEARLGAAVRHPNVVHVESIAEQDGWPYIVMEYVDGVTLAQILRRRVEQREPIAVEVVVAIAARVAEALHAAHECADEIGRPLNVVHRDVSPSNILIDRRGYTKLIDFGVARARARLAKTTPGSVKGKLAYMAPEQLAGIEFDRRVDVFALGVVIWEMLTLRRLFYAPTDIETIMKIRDTSAVEAPSVYRRDVPPRLDDVVGTMLARDLEERFCTTAAARHALLVTCPASLHVDAAALASLVASVEAPPPPISYQDATSPARPAAKRGV